MGKQRTLPELAARALLLAATVAVAIVAGLPITSRFDSISHVLYLFTRGSTLVTGVIGAKSLMASYGTDIRNGVMT